MMGVCVGSASELILVVGCKSLCVSLTWTAVGGAFQFVAASQILDHVITILLQTAVDSVLRSAVMLRSIVFLHSLISLYNYWCAVHNRQPFLKAVYARRVCVPSLVKRGVDSKALRCVSSVCVISSATLVHILYKACCTK